MNAFAPAYKRDDGLWVFSRREFVSTRFEVRPGNHVVFGGPSQNGKTTFAFDLLPECTTPEHPAYVVVSKPRDPVTEKRGKELGYPRVNVWPPPTDIRRVLKREKPSGYLIWPDFGDMETDVARARAVSKALLEERYAAGTKGETGIIVLDDTYLKSKVLKLDREMTTIHAMAGAMGIGAWTFVQKPTGAGETPIMAYGACEWAFLFFDPDKRSRERYDEIGGFDPRVLEQATRSLRKYQCLAIKRDGRFMCVVDRV